MAPRTSGPRYNVLPLSGRASVAIWCCAVIGRGDPPGQPFLIHSLLGLGAQVPVALLDSTPLKALLKDKLHLPGIDEAIRNKHLHAVAVTAFGYESGHAVTFYQGGGTIDAWLRHRRIGMPTQLTVEHLLASSAIPLLFAPVKLDQEYFGDGAVRQSAPISPALHLGPVACWWLASAATHAAMNPRRNVPTPARADLGTDRRAYAQQHLH